ncbi:hypothetical protein [Allisonella histaminiformans]|uniref:hypothetical protein n=1 Tax=Allisonella histaminiformans TaxID=209880 RepID=UPI002E7765DC|nr:hypothetical protein [Allisonella histaminiformans]
MDYTFTFRDGYEIFGPILWSYTSWLKMKVHEYKIGNILFFARDGYVLQKSYKILDSETSSKYFYASRRAVCIPCLSFNGTLNSLLHIYKSWPKEIKISQLLNRAGIEETIEFKHLLSEYGLNNNEAFSYNDLTKDFRIISLFNDLRPLILKKAKIQHGYFMKYFLQAASGDVIAMVDSGGRCTIEDALRTLLKGSECNQELYGFYLLLDVEESNHRQAWLNKQTERAIFTWIMRFCYYFLEILLSAPHGSVYGYKEENGTVIPQYDPFDYEKEDSYKDAEVIRDMQNGALEFVNDFNKYRGYGIQMNPSVVFAAFRNFGVFPYKEDLLLWGNLRFNADGFEPLAHPCSICFYLKHPKRFIKDVKSSYWLGGFFCQLFHGVWFNRVFFSIYTVLKNLHTKET